MPTQKPNDLPRGSLLLKTLAMPADTNANGDVFGGWIMSRMDIAGGILAKEVAAGRTATVAVDRMKFLKPVKIGDVVCCYGEVEHLEVWVRPALRESEDPNSRFKVTEANFVFVAIDDTGQKRQLHSEAKDFQ
jgi:acyl-CoA thioesterase YciA